MIIVDDDTAQAHVLSHELAALGFDVRGPARTPADGRRLLSAALPEIALISTRLSDGEMVSAFADELQARGVQVIMMGEGAAEWTGNRIDMPFATKSVIDLIGRVLSDK